MQYTSTRAAFKTENIKRMAESKTNLQIQRLFSKSEIKRKKPNQIRCGYENWQCV